MPEISFTQVFLSTAVGALISIIFSKFPKVDEWWAGKSSEFKSGVMIALVVVFGMAVAALSCSGLIVSDIVCTRAGLVDVAWTILFTAIGNSLAYNYTPQSSRIKAIKDARSK